MATEHDILCDIRLQRRMITADDLATLLGVQPSTIWDRVKSGRLPEPINRRPYRWAPAAIDRWLNQEQEPAA